MDLSYTPEEQAFRTEVKAFLDAELSQDLRQKAATGRKYTKQDFLGWQAALHKRGWGGPAWPKKFGGTGWSAIQRHIFDEEIGEAEAPMQIPFGVSMVAPVIMAFGSPEQQQEHLPKILSGERFWVQGYSEPGSGSDLASLKTRAERQGDHYVVNGQKTWTTLGQHGDWIFCLVRTSTAGKQQEGISFLLIDMKSPGVSVRPIKLLDGGYEVNDVFLEDVKVPVDQRIYEENKGWTCAKFLLAHERAGIAGVARSKRNVERLKTIAKAELGDDGKPLIESDDFQLKLAQLEIDLSALEMTELRVLAREHAGKGPGPESSLLKVKGTEIQQRLTELTLEAIGNYAQPYTRELGGNEFAVGPDYSRTPAPVYFNWRKASIYGGSNEIQRNIIAKMVLGL